jgi:hypothetical protein
LYEDKISNKKIEEIISTVSPKYVEKNENKFPIFEIVCNEDLPLNETLLPISKRKVLIKTT